MTRIPDATRCERSFTEIAWQTREASNFITDFRAGTDVAQAIVMANEQTVTTVSKTNPAVRAILAACFPQWKGRKVRLVVGGAVRSNASDWDGGTRCESRFYNLRDGGVVYVEVGHSAHAISAPDAHWAVVEHDTFCGKDAGVTIRVARSLDLADLAVAVDVLLEGGRHATVTAQALVADRVPGDWKGADGRGADARDLAWLEVEATAAALAKSQVKAGRAADRADRTVAA